MDLLNKVVYGKFMQGLVRYAPISSALFDDKDQIALLHGYQLPMESISMYQYAMEYPDTWPDVFIRWEKEFRKPEARDGNFNCVINYETLNYSDNWKCFTLTDFSKQIMGKNAPAMYRSANPLHA